MKLSESFYSIQGEGVTAGTPAYFVRVSGCNIICGGPNGCLLRSGRATWRCDSEPVWRQHTETTNDELLEKIVADGQREDVGILGCILNGTIHVVWTGGEPSMDSNRRDITGFLDFLRTKYPDNTCYHELETNGTIHCADRFYDRFDQINCSPKLANSGMKQSVRIVPDALRQIKAHRNAWFKFVITDEADIEEIETTYIEPFTIDRRCVVLMPGVDNLEDLPAATRFLYETCKKHGLRGVTRGHILAWDQTTGV